MRLTLVDNLVLPRERDLELLDVHPHLGLLSVAAVATAAGHKVSIYDPKRLVRSGALPYDETLYERVAESLLAGAPDAVGFSTLGCSFLFVLGVGRAVEAREPDLPLLLGGPHATMLARPLLERYPNFDLVVRHEVERTFADVLARLESRDFRDVAGVTWRRGDDIEETPGSPRIDDLDTLPDLDYELYPMADLDLDLIRVEAGRGCPFACTFCSTATFFQRRYRLKSPGRLVSEMNSIRDRYAPKEFKLDHDLFTANRRKVAEFCDAVRGHGHRWRVSARADCVDAELLGAMASAGCVGLYLGVETGSPRMQQISAKRLDLSVVEPVLDICQNLGIETTASFITGYPEETQADQDATLEMLGRCFLRPAKDCIPQLHILTPEPGTPLFAQHGSAMAYDGHTTPFNAWMLRSDDVGQVMADPETFSSYYFYPSTLDRATHVAVVEAVDVLRLLGQPALAALIDRHGGSLAALVRALVESTTGGVAPGRDDLERYVRRRLGDADPLTSAIRYALFAAEALPATEARPATGGDTSQPDADSMAGPLRVVAGTRVLHDVHRLRDIVEWLARGQPEHDQPARRATYVRRPGSDAHCALDPALADLLGCFADGHLAAEVAEALGLPPRGRYLEAVDQLVRAGLLVPVDS